MNKVMVDSFARSVSSQTSVMDRPSYKGNGDNSLPKKKTAGKQIYIIFVSTTDPLLFLRSGMNKAKVDSFARSVSAQTPVMERPSYNGQEHNLLKKKQLANKSTSFSFKRMARPIFGIRE